MNEEITNTLGQLQAITGRGELVGLIRNHIVQQEQRIAELCGKLQEITLTADQRGEYINELRAEIIDLKKPWYKKLL